MSTHPSPTTDRPAGEGLLVLDAATITELYPPEVAIESQRRAFTQLGLGVAQQPERLLMDGPGGSSTFCYAAKIAPDAPSVSKFGSVVPANARRGLPSISAVVMVLDAETGTPAALLDGTTVTTLRTAAASAAAVERLAVAGADVLAVVGTGVQAEAHARLISHALPLREVRIAGLDRQEARGLAGRLADLDVTTVACDWACEACAGAQVVALCTTSLDPVLDDGDVAAGTTVVTVGSFAPDRAEVPTALMAGADLVVVDHREIAVAQAGSVVRAHAEGVLAHDELVELGAIFAGSHPGRTGSEQIVVHNSVGIGVQDAAAAEAILHAASVAGRGHRVSL
ncbi:ornithine cyclodeaminase family protein [Mobilicoccus caccae]|uniref:Ornithine cyclodeaminase n=1 Tax=Mobilicoccus caccae TaxID=1859295 RepID=A0ABQ6IVL1_9MICO|nr:ornithine cyclodeaminase family protein [Mobilicoccus caccae]GMA41979.1 ornithine cyclodeaminase [Mobilicoccus caccae]